MHRRLLLDLIRDYAVKFPKERETITRFVEFIRRCPDCFNRSHREGHLTGSAWLLDRNARRALFTHHRKLNLWIQLGGHADGNSDLAQVALREAIEESGLDRLRVVPGIFDLDIHRIPARKGEPEHLHYDVRFVVKHDGDDQFVVSEESHDLTWIDVEKIQDLTTEESVMRMQKKWIRERNATEG